jgi:hypothetical protein
MSPTATTAFVPSLGGVFEADGEDVTIADVVGCEDDGVRGDGLWQAARSAVAPRSVATRLGCTHPR